MSLQYEAILLVMRPFSALRAQRSIGRSARGCATGVPPALVPFAFARNAVDSEELRTSGLLRKLISMFTDFFAIRNHKIWRLRRIYA